MGKIELYELSFIYWHRHFVNDEKVNIPSTITKTELTKKLGNITPEEFDISGEWIDSKIELSEYLTSYTPTELRTMLELRYRMSFPFPLSFLPVNKSHRLLLSWFRYVLGLKDSDFNGIRNPRSFNEDQLSVFKHVSSYKHGYNGDPETKIIVVNAGPGTGKTTTANSLAIQNMNEGVLLISYTNEAIKENYRRLHEYPGTYGKIGSGSNAKKWEKNITVATVDSLAARINETTTETEHDKAIRLAINNVSAIKFYHPSRGTFYQHVIVDECQDIDSLRGELILKFCAVVEAKTLTLFGDPRQRINGTRGEWYSQLWTVHGNPFIVQVPLTVSYRFDNNPKILEIVNKLSERRPSLHVTLTTSTDPEMSSSTNQEMSSLEPSCGSEPSNIIGVSNIGTLVDAILKSGNPGQWAVIGHTIDRNNKTAATAHFIATVFRANGIRCYFRSDGAFVADAVAFLTIASAKGKEFDNVILFGMGGYPKTFGMVPHDDAESLIYVAHSRAKRQMWYMIPDYHGESVKFTVPRGIDPEDVDLLEDHKIILDQQTITAEDLFKAVQEDSHPHFSVTELVDDHSFSKFMTINRFSATVSNTIDIPNWTKPVRPEYISKQLWGILLALRFQTILNPNTLLTMFKPLLTNNYIIKSKQQIASDKAKGKIISGKERGTETLVTDFQPDVVTISMIRSICRKPFDSITYNEWEYISRCYSLFICGNDSEIAQFFDRPAFDHSLPDYDPEFIKIIEGGSVEVQMNVNKYFHGQVDYIDPEGNIYELKTCGSSYQGRGGTTPTQSQRNVLQAWLYFVMLYAGTNNLDEGKTVFLVSLTEGKIYEVTSNRNVESWKYLLRCFHLLWYHNTLVQQRRSYLIDNGLFTAPKEEIPEKSYSVDTEFNMGSKEVFEIGMVNIYDIFSTFIDTPRPSSKQAFEFGLEWTKLPKRCFETSTITLPRRFKIAESLTLPETPPTLYHYLADADVIWYSKTYKVNTVDLGARARVEALKHGSFEAGNMPPRLGELYTLLSLVPLETQTHLTAHIALADALMLYELLVLGLI
jgi:hypothetical protein